MQAALRAGRALFVVFHLVAITLAALPSVGGAGLDRKAWKDPTVQGEFAAWSRRFAALGLDLPPDRIEELGWTVATAVESKRQLVLEPFEPYFAHFGTWQSWKMFVAPHRYPARLEIALDEGDGEFRPIYVARDPEHAWHRAWFDHDRMRAAVFRYGWEQYRGARKQFADWVARIAAAEFPDARRVRISFVHYRTPSPEEVTAARAAGQEVRLEQTAPPITQTRDLADLR